MNETNEQFEQVRRILVLKRHEVPPPGYFDHFSDRVIARIESETLVLEGSWWRRLVMSFDAKPIVAGAYSVGLGGLLFVGLSLVHVYEQERVEAQVGNNNNTWTGADAFAVTPVQAQLASSPMGFVNRTEPPSSTAPSFLFSTPTMGDLRPQAVSYKGW